MVVHITDCMNVCVGSKQQTLERAVALAVLGREEGGQQMSQQDQWQAHPYYTSMPGRQHCPNREANDSSTFVNPLHEGSLQSFSPYVYSPETAIPPPPPGIYSPLISQPKRNTRYQIALAVLLVLVVALGSLVVIQVTAHTPLTTYTSGSAGSNQTGTTSAQHATTPQKATPGRILTPGTINENVTLTCASAIILFTPPSTPSRLIPRISD